MILIYGLFIKHHRQQLIQPANFYLFKVSNRKTRKRCEICSKLTIKTPGNIEDGWMEVEKKECFLFAYILFTEAGATSFLFHDKLGKLFNIIYVDFRKKIQIMTDLKNDRCGSEQI